MFEYCLIPGFNIAEFATFGYLCSVKSNPHSCLITRYIAKEALNNYNCLFGCAQLLHKDLIPCYSNFCLLFSD